MVKEKVEKFEEWFNKKYGYSVPWSERRQRLLETAKALIENSEADLRKQIALKYLVSMRTALDYINEAKMIVEKWNGSNGKL